MGVDAGLSRIAIYLTHPEVNIDPAIATPDWGLSPKGAARVAALADRLTDLRNVQLCSSAERKALETAWPLAAMTGRGVHVDRAMGENDRAATGYLPPATFDKARHAFFGESAKSYCGWETAQSAQARVVDAVQKAVSAFGKNDLIFTGHGAVGTLLFCHLAGKPIDVLWDQDGPGHWFAFDPDSGAVRGGWSAMENLSGMAGR